MKKLLPIIFYLIIVTTSRFVFKETITIVDAFILMNTCTLIFRREQ